MTPVAQSPAAQSQAVEYRRERWRARWVFWEWCLKREACRARPYAILVAAIVLAAHAAFVMLIARWLPNRGDELLRSLFGVAALVIGYGGFGHAAQACCWEVSREVRDLVRLTGVGPGTLLWCTMLARWWTIALAIVLLAPFAALAVTFGGVTGRELLVAGPWLLMFAALMAGAAMFAAIASMDVENPEKSVSAATVGFLIFYHIAFGVLALGINFACWLIEGKMATSLPSSWWYAALDWCVTAMPVSGLWSALAGGPTCSLFDPRYWMHLIVAASCAWFATVLLAARFRPTHGDDEPTVSSPPEGPIGHIRRPRCGDAPFFWKDAQILIGRANQRNWSVLYVLGTVIVFASAISKTFDELSLALAFIATGYVPIIIAVRFDALLAAEFRQKTWGNLAILPIDRRVLLWAKLQAVAWEQRSLVLLVGTALAFAAQRQPVAIVMASAISGLTGIVLCQMSAMNHLARKRWWVGPCQAAVLVSLAMLCGFFWVVVPPWFSFVLSLAVIIGGIIGAQVVVDRLLDQWTEAEAQG